MLYELAAAAIACRRMRSPLRSMVVAMLLIACHQHEVCNAIKSTATTIDLDGERILLHAMVLLRRC